MVSFGRRREMAVKQRQVESATSLSDNVKFVENGDMITIIILLWDEDECKIH